MTINTFYFIHNNTCVLTSGANLQSLKSLNEDCSNCERKESFSANFSLFWRHLKEYFAVTPWHLEHKSMKFCSSCISWANVPLALSHCTTSIYCIFYFGFSILTSPPSFPSSIPVRDLLSTARTAVTFQIKVRLWSLVDSEHSSAPHLI